MGTLSPGIKRLGLKLTTALTSAEVKIRGSIHPRPHTSIFNVLSRISCLSSPNTHIYGEVYYWLYVCIVEEYGSLTVDEKKHLVVLTNGNWVTYASVGVAVVSV
jgi:hypothetical protein